MRKSIAIFCAVILVLCLWLLLHRTTSIKNSPVEVQASQTNQQPTNQVLAKPAQSLGTSTPSAASIAEAEARYRATPEGSNAFQQRILSHWQAPIEFYGRVVDENSNAISGVSVHFSWDEIPSENGERTTDTQSDSEGLFSLQGKHGPSLSVAFSKEGYYSSHRGEVTFNYALGPNIISPDPQNPVIFLLHKKGQGVELITSQNGIRPNRSDTNSKRRLSCSHRFFPKASQLNRPT